MGRKGLNTEVIAEAAIGLVEEKGYRNFSMRELAARLGVQPASLYNHVNGIEAVYTAVGLHGISILEKALEQAYGFQDLRKRSWSWPRPTGVCQGQSGAVSGCH